MTRLAQGLELLQPDVLPSAPATATFGQYFGGIATTIFALAATLAVLMVAFGGVQYILADTIFSKAEAKARITSALVGLSLLIVIALILETINPCLLGVDAFLGNFTGAEVSCESPEST